MRFIKCLFFLFLYIFSFDSSAQNSDFTFTCFADAPYYLPKDYEHLNKLVDTINRRNPAFNVFLGDLKSSYTPCEDSIYSNFFTILNRLNKPCFYTPGDNEWTDCNTHGFTFDPLERLNFLREKYVKPTIIDHCVVENQGANSTYKTYVENQTWNFNTIRFATFHVVGSNNNLNDKFALNDSVNNEYFKRNQANLAWLNTTFSKATNENAPAIVLLLHADMFTPDKGKSGFSTFLEQLAKLTEEYHKPVLLINGDSHKFLIDKPLKSIHKPNRTLLNFTRLQVYGELDPYATLIRVSPEKKKIFEFDELIIPLK